MRILLLSDIHANLVALETVLTNAGEFDACWCLGDIVGYGPQPNRCIDLIRSQPNLLCVLGNHDAAVSGVIDLERFNSDARTVVEWTKSQVTKKNLDWLAQLPLTAIVGSIQIVHGSPVNPIWDYVLDPLTAHDIMTLMEEDFCLVGHTHQPMVFNFNAQMSHPSWSIPHPGKPSRLVPRMMLNPGSIGQPRDRDPRSSYIILETDTMEFTQYRLEYDVQKTQQDMLSRNLPARMAHRLREGW